MTNTELEARLRHAVMTLAMMRARNEIKDAIRRQGKKLSLIPSAEINAMARARLAAHHQRLIPEVIPMIEEMLSDGFFGKKAQREWAQRAQSANVRSDAQSQGHCSTTTISVQDLCANWRAQR